MYAKNKIFKPILVFCLTACSLQSTFGSLPGVRITGGDEVSPHSLPFLVFLNFTGNDNTSWVCSGSLITQNYILTAARCGYEATSVEVTLGAHNLTEAEDSQLILQSESITVHQDFNEAVSAFVYENDIAVIALPDAVGLTDSIGLVKLPSVHVSEDTYVNKSGKISGWGQTDAFNSTSLSPVLLYQESTVISNDECSFVYYDLKDYDICMETKEDEGSPCFGDYGSPLLVDDVQIGIASQGVMYCIPGYPFIYTTVSSFLDWIKENTDYEDDSEYQIL